MSTENIQIPLLTSEDIEVKIKQVTKAGALALLYKTARVDRKILNEVYGPLNWTSDYKVVKDNLYCGIGIRKNSDQEFVWKWDCGVESGGDEDTAKKGEASDAFKRAGFAVGIGEELYSSPFIWLSVETIADGNKYKLKDPYARYVVTHIAYNEKTRVITELEICNAKSNVKVFSWSMPTSGAIGKKMVNTLADDDDSEDPKPVEATKKADIDAKEVKTSKSTSSEKTPLKTLISEIGKMVKAMYTKDSNTNRYTEIIKEVTGDNKFKCNTATEAEYDLVFKIHDLLVAGGYNA